MNEPSSEPTSFAAVWERITGHGGEFFQTSKGRYFTYRIEEDALLPSQTDLRISRSDFELAFSMVPIPTSAKLNRLVEAPSYIWAILHDERIRCGAW